jgi:hypothetical protein
MNRAEQIKTQIAQLQAELAEIESDGFKPLSELAWELEEGDLIEVKVFSLDPGAYSPVALKTSDTSNYIDHIDHKVLARKSRPALNWITAAEAAQMPDIVGKRAYVDVVIVGRDDSETPLDVRETGVNIDATICLDKNTKLAVLDDE